MIIHNIFFLSRVTIKAGLLSRLCTLEARAARRVAGLQALYLPFIFISYGLLLGTVYYQTLGSSNILASFGILSCASSLFMFPVIYVYLFRALDVR